MGQLIKNNKYAFISPSLPPDYNTFDDYPFNVNHQRFYSVFSAYGFCEIPISENGALIFITGDFHCNPICKPGNDVKPHIQITLRLSNGDGRLKRRPRVLKNLNMKHHLKYFHDGEMPEPMDVWDMVHGQFHYNGYKFSPIEIPEDLMLDDLEWPNCGNGTDRREMIHRTMDYVMRIHHDYIDGSLLEEFL
jgi:hypothetical protein